MIADAQCLRRAAVSSDKASVPPPILDWTITTSA
jgi:hypothetical protein